LVVATAANALLVVLATFTGAWLLHAAVVVVYASLALGVAALSAAMLWRYGLVAPLSCDPKGFARAQGDALEVSWPAVWMPGSNGDVCYAPLPQADEGAPLMAPHATGAPARGAALAKLSSPTSPEPTANPFRSSDAHGAAAGMTHFPAVVDASAEEGAVPSAGSSASLAAAPAALALATTSNNGNIVSSGSSSSSSSSSSWSLREAASAPAFWLVFAAFAVGVGSGLTVLDNVALIVDAHETMDDDDGDGSTGAESSLKANAVALFSACNTGGRIVLGLLSDRAVASGRASRAACLAVVLAGLAVAMLALAFANLSTILGSVALTAFWYGGLWVLVPALVADLFGSASYGRIYGLVSLAPTAGSWLLYDDLSVRLYDEYEDDANGTCTDDPACFTTTFVVLAVCCAAGAAAAWAAAQWPPRRAFAVAKPASI
jgi:hypothetical protein